MTNAYQFGTETFVHVIKTKPPYLLDATSKIMLDMAKKSFRLDKTESHQLEAGYMLLFLYFSSLRKHPE